MFPGPTRAKLQPPLLPANEGCIDMTAGMREGIRSLADEEYQFM